ncbi:type VII secretion protein EccB [Micromonospora sp. HUAS LYJ1]|uniref:type VII secretion protein EccB n=1 Tax=Micromonospora sp. HUAS LYJ1 TaxID=3061626 RepID=UPI0026722163|nr:type VII secretion protein EccB [Micromonospora sp. HUAS LYJ1]WKU05348.1 type VII secretion protein EccB [Micromonospora sp. HUAS LYJ1]
MQTQRDHVHAHQFQMARMSSALLLGDPSMADNPMRRTVLGLGAGVMVAVLVVVCFGIYGWIVPGGNDSWRTARAILVEKETGDRYVYAGERLHPVIDPAAARIVSGGPSVRLVSRSSLAGVPRGAPIGIPGAPQLLPTGPEDVLSGPWLVCLGDAGRLGVNLDPSAPATELPPDRFMLVSGGADDDYLIWRGHRHRISDKRIPVALGATNAVAVTAPPRWLTMVPAGDDLEVPSLPGDGRTIVTIDGRRATVGALFTQAAAQGREQLFVLRADGLAPINRTMFQIVQATSGTRAVTLSAAAVAAAPRSADRTLWEPFAELSTSTPAGLPGSVLCQRQSPTPDGGIDVRVVLTSREFAAGAPGGGAALRPGAGMVVQPVPRTRGAAADLVLIGGRGERFGLPDADANRALGLTAAPVVPFPRDLLLDLPSGPALTRAAVVAESDR